VYCTPYHLSSRVCPILTFGDFFLTDEKISASGLTLTGVQYIMNRDRSVRCTDDHWTLVQFCGSVTRWAVFKLTAKGVDMSTEQAYWEKNVSKLHLVDGRMVRYAPVHVRKNIEGTLEQEVRAVRKVYRRQGGQVDDGTETLNIRSDRDAVQRFMVDYVVDAELIERTLKVWDEQVSNTRSMGAGRTYKWRSGLKLVQYTFELRSILALINTLVQCMPEPVQEIRHTLIHGDDGEQKNKADIMFSYDDTVQAYIRFAVAIVTPYAVRKIRGEERRMTGQVYERSLYRTTDMGQGGRRFSDADISDVLSRTILASFFPLYCRSLPLTDKGKAYVLVKSCTVVSCKVGVRVYTKRKGVAALHQLDTAVRKFRKGKMTEQEYNDFLSKFTLPKKGKRTSVEKCTDNGFWITLRCDQTEQLFKVFTASASRADELRQMSSFSGEVDKVIPVDKGEVTIMMADSVYGWSVEGTFFRSLKAMTRNLYRFLMRRTEYDDQMITEHAESRAMRKNAEHLFSLKEVMDEHNGILTDVQKYIIEVETSLEVVPSTVHRNNRKVWLYNCLVEARTGINPKLTRYKYEQLREVEFHCIAVQLGLVEVDDVQLDIPDEDEISVLYRNPLWIKERADRVQLTSFETAFAVQSGLDRRTVYRPQPYFVYDDEAGMMYINCNLNERTLTGGCGHIEPVQLTPVQHPVLSRPMARHIAGVRAISGPVDVENPTCKTVHLDTMTVNGFKVPVWTAEQETYVQRMPQLNIRATLYEPLPEGVYGPSLPCGHVVVMDKHSVVQPYLTKATVQVSYIDMCTADGDGI